MAKVLLVEDDNNLREIYEMRLQAEGYETLTAGNGEEGLTVAMKEKPDLIIADVMMPKLSGFDMLETLRAAPEMKNTKVIMMTALGQAEDQERGKALGVIKYLVKSQATLEDFARTIKEVMPTGSEPTASKEGQAQNNQESENKMQEDPTTNQTPGTPPAGNQPAPASDPMSPPAANPMTGDGTPADAGQMSSSDESSNVASQINNFVSSTPTADPSMPPAAPTVVPPATDDTSTGGSEIPVATPPADSVPPADDQGASPSMPPTDPAAPPAV